MDDNQEFIEPKDKKDDYSIYTVPISLWLILSKENRHSKNNDR